MSEELHRRTKQFALDVIKVCSERPQTREMRHVIGQVIRSSSSTAANYRSACRAKSKPDFMAKLGIVEQEADESSFWLEMLRPISRLGIAKFQPQSLLELDRLEDEANQLVAIAVASKKTARSSSN
ncbi:MAG TPA: four helix bundle protein [Terrimicrobiaceae bacterium]